MSDKRTEEVVVSLLRKASKSAGARNFIVTRLTDGRTQCMLSVFINNKPSSWIKYNAEQLDELIRHLQVERMEMQQCDSGSL